MYSLHGQILETKLDPILSDHFEYMLVLLSSSVSTDVMQTLAQRDKAKARLLSSQFDFIKRNFY